MHHRPRSLLLFLLPLAVGLACVAVPPARATTSVRIAVSSASGVLDVRIGSEPRWSEIRGTRILRIDDRDCPDHDVFRYGGVYYIFDDGRWYASRRARGRFLRIEDRRVPAALCALPREHWRRYPSDWMVRNRRHGGEGRGHERGRGEGHGKGHGDGHGKGHDR